MPYQELGILYVIGIKKDALANMQASASGSQFMLFRKEFNKIISVLRSVGLGLAIKDS